MLNDSVYRLTQDLQGAIFTAAMKLRQGTPPAPIHPLLDLRRGLAESPAWFMVQAQEFAPEPLSVERLRVRAVWSSERIVAALLDLMASEKWFDRVDDDYHLTDEGKAISAALVERRRNLLIPLGDHLGDALDPAERLMRQTLDASQTSPTPPSKWCLAHSRNRAPGDDQSPALKLFQYCGDFNAYRDDSHMTAFQPLGVPAYAWEAFNFVWTGTGDTAQTIYDQLAYRGYSRAEYGEGLQMLVEQGWLESDGEHFRVTSEGQAVREDVERLTDDYFFAAWVGQTDALINEMTSLKEKLEGM